MTVNAVAAAVEQVESRGEWWAERGCHRGVMQVCTRWAKVAPARLWLPEDNRREGRRLLAYWYRKGGYNWAYALAAYRCGWGGLQGKCGQGYARKVLGLLMILLCACDPDKPQPTTQDATDSYEVIDPYGDNEYP